MYQFAFKNLWTKKSRTVLAMIGLIVAIFGIIGLVSISDGIRYEITNVFSKMEGVTIMEKGIPDDSQSRVSLDLRKTFEGYSEVKTVIPGVTGFAVNFEKKGPDFSAGITSLVAFMGFDPSAASKLQVGSIYHPKIVSGRFLKSSDRNSVLLTKKLAEDYNKHVGSSVEFNGKKFKVVGIVDPEIDLFGNIIYTPLEVAQEMAGRDANTVNFFHLDLKNPKDSDKLASKINFRHADENFEATSSSGFAGTIGGVLENLDLFLIGVASISLIIGVVGILNTMLMSVKERTREFGILKAVGWTSEDIIRLVLFESVFLGIIGGLVGVVFSTVVVVFVINPLLPFPMKVTLSLAFYSFLVALTAGVIGGVYPAWTVSKLDPIEAIRYE